MGENIIIIHGGGPSAVLNSSLYGVIDEAKKSGKVNKIYAAKNGTGGLLREDILDLTDVADEKLKLLLQTPGSAIGTSRDDIKKEDYERMLEILEKRNIRHVLFNGGNGTMDTCGKLYKTALNKGADLKLMGIPKTMDNDIAVTSHSPGFGSVALYMAQSIKEICFDVKSLPIHVVVVEALGRNSGFVTAASALAKDEDGLGPDLIYLPELAFDEDKFIEDVGKCLERKSGIVVVASEGLKDKEGNPVVKPIFKTDRATYFGDVSAHLANLVVQKLGYKARAEKPGILARASMETQSPTDREEAVLVGREALKAVLEGESGKMVALRRKDKAEYEVETFLVDIDEVMMFERKMPENYINEEGNGVSEEFINWCRPLLGRELKRMISFN